MLNYLRTFSFLIEEKSPAIILYKYTPDARFHASNFTSYVPISLTSEATSWPVKSLND
ncbi:MAG: hypothetical protein OQJ93_09300 [Ignavibacteriaceae bacterium]|nr:hypothetical protein [Ignavibacteriaceae bacterium]